MPFTFIFAVLFILGIILAALLIPVSIVLFVFLFVLKKKKTALFVFLFVFLLPVWLLFFSVFMPLYISGHMWINDLTISRLPTYVFITKFGFNPDEQTEVLEAYVASGFDSERTLIKFRTTKETIDKIVHDKFNAIPSETLKGIHVVNRSNLPERVQAWFTPSYEKPNQFYLAEPFDNSFSNVNEAILCYNEETGIAYFQWIGFD